MLNILKINLRHLLSFRSPLTALLLYSLPILSIAQSSTAECRPKIDLKTSKRVLPFVIAESFLYTTKPDLSIFGIQSFRIIDRGIWKDGKQGRIFDLARVQSIAKTLKPSDQLVILDIESFDLTGSEPTVRSSIKSLSEILSAFRESAPNKKFGYYGIIPTRDYWRAQNDMESISYKNWQSQNDRLSSLADVVDIILPSVYTFYTNRDGWVKYAVAQICEARRIAKGKPVYIFIWNEYHDSNRKLKYTSLEQSYWRLQLDTAFEWADGVAMWGGYDMTNRRQRVWDDRAPWWLETKQFSMRVASDPTAPH